MSQPQEPSKPFFSFGNPFRMRSHKASQLSPTLQALLNSFEESLAGRLRKLEPKDTDSVLTLSWMKQAMESLCETHKDIKTLIADLNLPVTNWDEQWIDVYLNISVKLLDMSIAFSSELSSLSQGHLFLQCALHHLESSSSSDLKQQSVRARSNLESWRQKIGSKNPKLENCGSFLEGLMETLNLPKVKNSSKGKVLMRAMYGVKVQTIFICSVFLAALSGSTKKLLELQVSEKSYIWAQVFNNLMNNVNGVLLVSSGKPILLKELEVVDTAVKKLQPLLTENGSDSSSTQKGSLVSELKVGADELSRGLDLVVKQVDSFFQIVLSGRDALLSNLRANCTGSDKVVVNGVGKLVA